MEGRLPSATAYVERFEHRYGAPPSATATRFPTTPSRCSWPPGARRERGARSRRARPRTRGVSRRRGDVPVRRGPPGPMGTGPGDLRGTVVRWERDGARIVFPRASAPSRKYLGIRTPLHPLRLRCTPSPYLQVRLGLRLAGRGASTFSVRQTFARQYTSGVSPSPGAPRRPLRRGDVRLDGGGDGADPGRGQGDQPFPRGLLHAGGLCRLRARRAGVESPLAAAPLAAVIAFAFGVFLGKSFVNPARSHPFALPVGTLACALLFEQAAQMVWGPHPSRSRRAPRGSVPVVSSSGGGG